LSSPEKTAETIIFRGEVLLLQVRDAEEFWRQGGAEAVTANLLPSRKRICRC
jgi:hypothetical protein